MTASNIRGVVCFQGAHDPFGPLINSLEQEFTPLTRVARVEDLERVPFEVTCIIVPLILENGSGGVPTCATIRQIQRFSSTPIIALSSMAEKATQRNFYRAGATVLLSPPYDSEVVYLQLRAITFAKPGALEPEAPASQDSFSDLAILVLESMREPFAICQLDGRVVFVNREASALFAVGESDVALIQDQCSRLVEQYAALPRNGERSSITTLLRRKDYLSFTAEVVIEPLRIEASLLGVVLYFTAMQDIDRMSHAVASGSRARALTLLLASAALKLLPSGGLGVPSSPLKYVEQLLESEAPSTTLLPIVTAVTEIVDLITLPGLTLKVDIRTEFSVEMKRWDLFQLLGHLFLFSGQLAGTGGEVMVVGVPEPGNSRVLHLSVTGTMKRVPLRSGHVFELLQEKVLHPLHEDSRLEQDQNLAGAQKIAGRYNLPLHLRRPSPTKVITDLTLRGAVVG